MTDSPCFVERQSDGDGGDEDDTSGVDIVAVRHPQDHAADLEHVERIQHLPTHTLTDW